MGFFRRGTPMDPAHLTKLERELRAMKESLEHHQRSTSELSQRLSTSIHEAPTPAQGLDSLVARVEEMQAKHAELDAKLAASGEAPAAAPEFDALVARVEEVQAKHADLEGKLAELSARISSVSTELANQITELGHDIDALGEASTSGGPAIDESTIGALRDGQVRLANEQARYQIAFRDDLAKLAEQLRRPAN